MAAAVRMQRMARAWLLRLPWEKLRRATSIPARIIRVSTAASTQLGPTVAMILVRRTRVRA